jgi:hypothetical protein
MADNTLPETIATDQRIAQHLSNLAARVRSVSETVPLDLEELRSIASAITMTAFLLGDVENEDGLDSERGQVSDAT